MIACADGADVRNDMISSKAVVGVGIAIRLPLDIYFHYTPCANQHHQRKFRDFECCQFFLPFDFFSSSRNSSNISIESNLKTMPFCFPSLIIPIKAVDGRVVIPSIRK